MAIFLKKMKILGNFFLEKMSSFWQFFDSQMAIFRRVRYKGPAFFSEFQGRKIDVKFSVELTDVG